VGHLNGGPNGNPNSRPTNTCDILVLCAIRISGFIRDICHLGNFVVAA
jgi:hypothetical protein